MDSLLNDVRFAFRSLVKSPLATVLAVVCLALGIGANATIFSVVDMTVLRPLPFADPDRLVTAWSRHVENGVNRGDTSYADFESWRDGSQAFAAFAGQTGRSLTFSDTDEPERVSGAAVSWSLFSVVGIVPALGRDFTPADDAPGAAPVVILSDDLWRRRYNADPATVGRAVTVNGRPHVVIGVLPPRVKFPFQQVAWVPLAPLMEGTVRADRNLAIFARLKPGFTRETAQQDLGRVARERAATEIADRGWDAVVEPLHQYFIPTQVRLVTLAAMGAVTLVLLIACANVANLLLARATVRAREMSLRTALGADRSRIVRQLLTESVLLGLVSAPLGLVVARIGIALLDAAVPFDDIPYLISWSLDGKTLGYTMAVSALTGIVFGLAPALQVSRTNLVEVLREGGRTGAGGGRAWARNALVVAEVAGSLVLLVGASLFMRSFMNLQFSDGGFDARPLLTLRFYMPGAAYEEPDARARRVADVVSRVEQSSGVLGAAASNHIPLGSGGGEGRLTVEGRGVEPGREPSVFYAGVTPHFFSTLGVPIVRGRDFTNVEGETGSDVAIVNVSMALKFFGAEPAAPAASTRAATSARLRTAADLGSLDPVGRRFRLQDGSLDRWFTIVGVVPDVAVAELGDNYRPPAAYVSYSHMQTPNTGLVVRVRGDAGAATAAVRQAIRESDPGLPVFTVRTMEEVRRFGFWQHKLFGSMFSVFGALALLLAAVGVYGVLSYSVTQRTQEFGVRMALGASATDVRRLMVRQALGLAAFGIAVGLAGSFVATRAIKTLLYNVTPTDPLSFIGVVVFLTAVAWLAAYLPARRATQVDPIVALRTD
ncbi:MAG: ABC transporter permease [Vicinamibacterales bacterium]